MSPIDVDKLVEMAPEAIPLPATTLRIIKLINDPTSTAAEVAGVMEKDQALTARVLRVANSAYYGLPRQVSSARDAVVLLGHNTLRSLIFTASVAGVLGRKATGYSLGEGDLWKHSVNVANGSRLLSRFKHRTKAEEAYVAGLLHDIGKIVLDQYMQTEFEKTMKVAQDEGLAFSQAERKVLGVDHAQIGGLLAERWELPPQYVTAIRHHHTPLEADDDKILTSLVHVADVIAFELGLGLGADGLHYTLAPECFDIAGVTQEQYEEVIEAVGSTASEAENLFA